MGRLDVSYERAYIASVSKECFTKMLDSLIDHNYRHGTPLSSKILKKQLADLSKRKEKIPNVLSKILPQILCFSPPSISIHKRKIQT